MSIIPNGITVIRVPLLEELKRRRADLRQRREVLRTVKRWISGR